jgi:GH35 family endo-1,4-beta-xylanase
VTLRVVDGVGAPLPAEHVRVRQVRPDFAFGAAISRRLLDSREYQEFVKARFSWAVFGNESKWYANERERGVETYGDADALLDWCEANGLEVRGHTVFWEPERWQPKWVPMLEGQELRSAVERRLESAVTHFEGRFRHWDVNNEMLHGSFFRDRLGEEIWPWMFERVHELDPEALLFVNEFNILSVDQAFEAVETDEYVRQIRWLLDRGAPVQGIGVQGHIWHDDIVAHPEVVQARLDALATLGLPIWITEYDSADPEEAVNADRLEVVYRTAFAHPAVEGVLAWVVWAGDSWRGPSAAWAREDWTLTASGERYDRLMDEWSTTFEGATDGLGRIHLRGFCGDYELTPASGAARAFTISCTDGPDQITVRPPSPIAMDDVIAWCIVPFDSRKRTPEERIDMLEDLGFKRYAYDWREEHLADTARELRLAEERGIDVTAVWMWIDGENDRPGQLSESNERLLAAVAEAGISTQLWLGFNESFFEGLSDGERVAKGAEMVGYLSDRAAETGSRVALYNHGGWFGEPENQIRIIEALDGRDVGIVYNFHYGHEQIDRFDALVDAMMPHLWVVNLNGMRPEGPKILPFGAGTDERKMLQRLLDAGFAGPFGVLGHVDDADVRVILERNLEGLGLRPPS